MRRALAAVALFVAAPLMAHVGDLNSVFEGMAGPYPIRVVVRTPGVVPGRAQITVRTSAPDLDRIAVKPVRWDALEAGSPPPDVAQPVRGERGLYAAELWLMANGSHSIYVDVTGKRGSGRAIVPVTNMAVKRLPMPRALGIVLAILGAILVAGAISIVGRRRRNHVLIDLPEKIRDRDQILSTPLRNGRSIEELAGDDDRDRKLFGRSLPKRGNDSRISSNQKEAVVRVEEKRHQNRVFARVPATTFMTSSRSSPTQPAACFNNAAAVERRASGGIAERFLLAGGRCAFS